MARTIPPAPRRSTTPRFPELYPVTSLQILEHLAKEFSSAPEHVRSTLEMIDAGLSAPFIGRVRRAETGGIPEIIRPHETGLLARPGNSDDLAARIGDLLDDRALARRLAAGGREWVESEFSVDRMVEGTLEVYARMADGIRV